MTQPAPIRSALHLAASGLPVLPLRAAKLPVSNCSRCRDNACGGRPAMKSAGPCACPGPCHGWAAATTDPDILNSPSWTHAWHEATAVAYHPGGAGLTVVDLDNPDAITWARATLPPTRTVATTRGQHWIYRGTMASANNVRPGVDIKSSMSYARYLDPGTGRMVELPDAVRALTVRPKAAAGQSGVVRARWDRNVATGCRHTETFIHTGVERGVAKVCARTEQGAGSQAFGAARFLGAQHTNCPGPCDLEGIGGAIVSAAVTVGVPERYATRAVWRGFAAAGKEVQIRE